MILDYFNVRKLVVVATVAWVGSFQLWGQSVIRTSSTEKAVWQQSKDRLKSTAEVSPIFSITGNEKGTEWKAWGTTFNELDWDALLMLTRDEQEEIMYNLFAPQGDLKFTRGRISMNCNDYGRSWYSCDEVQGDLELRYFNIERDKRSIIPLIRAAQKYNSALTFWASPWSPPSWMKINNDYPVVSSRHNHANPNIDYLLYGSVEGIDENEMQFLGERKGKFPRRLATQDYFIQDPRYLQAYANYFCKFIDAYKEQGVNIDMIIYQNEAYSYTPYPGCAWTAEGTVCFNRDYLAPTLRSRHPEVKLYLGTFNTNRRDHVEKILSDGELRKSIDGIAFQWEGREILPEIRRQYPDYHYICSESECGNGSMDWKAGEHTFFLISDNAGNGCDEWFNWNFLLPDNGTSPWGWKQNALIQVDSKTRKFRYTAEYYAVKHFTHYVIPGSRMINYYPQKEKKLYTVVWQTPAEDYVTVIGNFGDTEQSISIGFGKKFLNTVVKPHSFNTYCINHK